MSFEQWEAVFDRAREHLRDGGIFVFDVNTERKLASFAEGPPWMQWFGEDSLLLIDVRDGEDRTYDWKVRVFEHVEGSTYRLHAEDIREAAFPVDQIKSAIGRALLPHLDLRRGARAADDAIRAPVLRLPLEPQLEKNRVSPDAVELGDSLAATDDAEAEALVKREARGVLGEHARLDRPDPVLGRARDEVLHERSADSAPACVLRDIDRMLDDTGVAGPRGSG